MIQLESKEVIIYTARKHWFIFLIEIIFVLAAAVMPVLIIYFVLETGITNLIIFLYLIWLLILWIVMTLIWTDYYLDVWLVTNCRVINIEQKGLFNRVVAEHKLFRIQDVRSEQKGIMPTFLNYGEVHIQTAGAEKVVVFEEVPRPHYVAQEIIKLVENHKIKMAREISLKGGSPSGGEKIDQPERIE